MEQLGQLGLDQLEFGLGQVNALVAKLERTFSRRSWNGRPRGEVGMDALEAIFVARRNKQDAGTIGSDEKTADAEEEALLTVRALVYATYDKIYVNIVEAPTDQFERDNVAFGKYLEKFKVKI